MPRNKNKDKDKKDAGNRGGRTPATTNPAPATGTGTPPDPAPTPAPAPVPPTPITPPPAPTGGAGGGTNPSSKKKGANVAKKGPAKRFGATRTIFAAVFLLIIASGITGCLRGCFDGSDTQKTEHKKDGGGTKPPPGSTSKPTTLPEDTDTKVDKGDTEGTEDAEEDQKVDPDWFFNIMKHPVVGLVAITIFVFILASYLLIPKESTKTKNASMFVLAAVIAYGIFSGGYTALVANWNPVSLEERAKLSRDKELARLRKIAAAKKAPVVDAPEEVDMVSDVRMDAMGDGGKIDFWLSAKQSRNIVFPEHVSWTIKASTGGIRIFMPDNPSIYENLGANPDRLSKVWPVKMVSMISTDKGPVHVFMQTGKEIVTTSPSTSGAPSPDTRTLSDFVKKLSVRGF